MSITEELRVWASVEVPYKYGHQLCAIADRIDAEHESACAEAYGSGVMSVPIALDESQWVRLPVDADGEPVHIGDVMEWPTTGETFEVVGIGDGTLFYIEDGSELADWTGASTKRHHAPTVEDVLREMLDAWGELPSNATNEAIIAEYAAKLREMLDGDSE